MNSQAKESKFFKEIMQEVLRGMNGDTDHDLQFILAQAEIYKDHEYGIEITRALGRLICKLLPDDKRVEIDKLFSDHKSSVESTLEEVRFNQTQGEVNKAVELIKPLINEYDSLSTTMYQDDTESTYFCFDSPAEEITYIIHNDVSKTIRRVPEQFATIFTMYASLLFELKEHSEAIGYLEKALRWNPAAAAVYFELGENYKQLGEMEAFHEYNSKAYPYILNASDLARFLRGNGFYHIEKQQLELASACFLVSLLYEQSQMVAAELFYIRQKYGEDYAGMKPDKAIELLEQRNIPFRADPNTLSGLVHLLSLAANNDDLPTLAETLKDLYELTGNQEFYDRFIELKEGGPLA